MAGARGRLHKSLENATPRRSTRRGKASQDIAGVPEVFQNLLSEEHATKANGLDEDARPLKKRKTARSVQETQPTSEPEPEPAVRQHSIPAPVESSQAKSQSRSQLQAPSQFRSQPLSSADKADGGRTSERVRQTIIDSDESDDSDMEWEDALEEDNSEDEEDAVGAEPVIGDISITFGGANDEEKTTKKQARRRAITSVDKKRRLDIHKMHVLCLLYHVYRRNAWCNDRRAQAILRKLPSPKTLSNLVPNPEYSQYQASKRFIDGMNELKLMWSKRFSVTAQGMYKPRWAEADAEVRPFSDFDELDDPMERDDFRTAALKLEGSQDVGAQLFCALLRAIGVEARLVCSLQCLPFASAAQPSTPQKPSTQKHTIVLDPYNTQKISPSKPKATGASRSKRPSRLELAIGERHTMLSSGVAPKQRKKYHTPYPVYWVEAFNSAHQKWVPIDPLSTFTVNAPEKLEPPLSFAQNSLIYAVAFDDDYTAKDVTRRYTKAYNAKTRKFRVESTPHGDKWWKRTLKFFSGSMHLDRDQVEDAALARREAAEGIPKNVQDFKDHPVYVLERHLRHNEVIYPMNQVGKVNVGTSMNPKMEPIFRRKDVHTVRSADKWYRLGRDVKDGEQPLKHAKPKKGKRLSIGPDMDLDDQLQQEEIGAGLYAEFQTELYVPPPVIRGRVPRNAYGNLDLYVPSMCPLGGVHIRHKLASKAARIVGADYADAVTGFSFKGRHGTAIVQGVVVAQEYAEAVETVIEAMEYGQEEAENQQRRSEALHLWRRFYLGLRIAQRVNAIEIDGEKGNAINVQEEIDKEDKEIAEKEFAGGFFPEEGDTTEPPVRGYVPPAQNYEYGGGFIAEVEDEDGGGFVPEAADEPSGFVQEEQHSFGSAILSQQQLRPRRTSSFVDEYISDEDEDGGGGFILESHSPEAGPSKRKDHWPGGRVQDTGVAEHIGGGFIPEPEPAEDTTGSMIHVEPTSSKTANASLLERNLLLGGPSLERTEQTQMSEETRHIAVPASITPVAADEGPLKDPSLLSSSPSDVGSLPLEDPEDEDADPDWLVDAT